MREEFRKFIESSKLEGLNTDEFIEFYNEKVRNILSEAMELYDYIIDKLGLGALDGAVNELVANLIEAANGLKVIEILYSLIEQGWTYEQAMELIEKMNLRSMVKEGLKEALENSKEQLWGEENESTNNR